MYKKRVIKGEEGLGGVMKGKKEFSLCVRCIFEI
jgi:hypothetical protein